MRDLHRCRRFGRQPCGLQARRGGGGRVPRLPLMRTGRHNFSGDAPLDRQHISRRPRSERRRQRQWRWWLKDGHRPRSPERPAHGAPLVAPRRGRFVPPSCDAHTTTLESGATKGRKHPGRVASPGGVVVPSPVCVPFSSGGGCRSRGCASIFNIRFRRGVPHHQEARSAVCAGWQRFPRSTPRPSVGVSRIARLSPDLCLLSAPPAPPQNLMQRPSSALLSLLL